MVNTCPKLLLQSSVATLCSHRWTSAKDTQIHAAVTLSPPSMSSYTCSISLSFPGPASPLSLINRLHNCSLSALRENTSSSFTQCVQESCASACRKFWIWVTTRNLITIKFWAVSRPATKKPSNTRNQGAFNAALLMRKLKSVTNYAAESPP